MSKEPQFSIGDKLFYGFQHLGDPEVKEVIVTAVWAHETFFGREFLYSIGSVEDGELPVKSDMIRERDLSTTASGAWRKLQAHLRGDLAAARQRVTDLAKVLDLIGETIQNMETDNEVPH